MPVPKIHIDSIHHLVSLGESNYLLGYSIDSPLAGSQTPIQAISIAGWLLGKNKDVDISSVKVYVDSLLIKEVPLSVFREDVSSSYSLSKQEKSCGFSVTVGTVGFPCQFEILLKACIENVKGGSAIIFPFALIRGVRKYTRGINYRPKRQPIMLTSIPRSGTTWVMKIISSIPSVISHAEYPDEMRVASYWLHAMKILSDPADYVNSTTPDYFDSNMDMIGHNPYNDHHYFSNFPETLVLHSDKVLANIAECCMKNIDLFYDAIEADKKEYNNVFFLEKNWPNHIQNIYRELYENPKEIILVRDLRDIICSSIHFNEKRGTKEFRRGEFKTDRDWIINMRVELVDRILIAIKRRKKNVLLLHYEDVVQDLDLTVRTILGYLNVDISDSDYARIIHRASVSNMQMKEHQTSDSSMDSIGRWRRNLSDEIKEIFDDVLKDALIELGYEG